jgi:hypothetical protein
VTSSPRRLSSASFDPTVPNDRWRLQFHQEFLGWIWQANHIGHTAQFVSEDPIGLAGGDANTRRYVNNQPVDAVDPSGMYDAECTYEKGSKTETIRIKCEELVYPWDCCEKERTKRGLIGWKITKVKANDRGLVRAKDCETTCTGYMKYYLQFCADEYKKDRARLACCGRVALHAVDLCMAACLPLGNEGDDVVAGEEAYVEYFDRKLKDCKDLKWLRWVPFLV